VSIGQNGYNDNGNTDTSQSSIVFPVESGLQFVPAGYWRDLTVSADGSYVFFQSTDALTPGAFDNELTFDGSGYANNVYEYHDGNVYLISGGHDPNAKGNQPAVRLVGTDASGDDVFFMTAEQLVPQDTDTNMDVYDARVDGGFPVPLSPPECSGDGCQGPLSPAPTLLAPGSEFQAGEAGPLAVSAPAAAPKAKAKSLKCRKGFVKKQGRCVKAKRSSRAKKASIGRRASR